MGEPMVPPWTPSFTILRAIGGVGSRRAKPAFAHSSGSQQAPEKTRGVDDAEVRSMLAESVHLGGAGLRPAGAQGARGGTMVSPAFEPWVPPFKKTEGRSPGPQSSVNRLYWQRRFRPSHDGGALSEPPTLARRFPSGHGDTPLPAGTSTARTVITQTDHLLSAVRSAYASAADGRNGLQALAP